MKIVKGVDRQANNYIDNVTRKLPVETDKRHIQDIGRGSTRSRNIVYLSHASRDLQIAQEAVIEAPDMRTDRVRPIKIQLSDHTYKIDYDSLAGKIIGSMIDDLA
jgi:anti-sigma28 factor (negative regulator of flagellin synthesis)